MTELEVKYIRTKIERLEKENEELKQQIEELKWEQKQILEDNDYWQEQFTKADKERAELQKAITEKNSVVDKMKCCENCKHHSFWGDELKCNFLSYDEELECMKDKHEWELVE